MVEVDNSVVSCAGGGLGRGLSVTPGPSVTGQMVVETAMVEVTTTVLDAGQLGTFLAHRVIV